MSSEYILNINNFLNLIKNNEGTIIELGTYKGKTTNVLGNFIKSNNLNDKILTFDTFKGYTEIDIKNAKTIKEKQGLTINNNSNRWNINKEEVDDFFKNNNINQFINIIEGDICETIKNVNNNNIKLVYVDCNAYNPAFNALAYLYNNNSFLNSCFIIIDEHTIAGESNAVNDFIIKYSIEGNFYKLDTNYLTGPRIIFHYKNEDTQLWNTTDNILKSRYKQVYDILNN